MPAKKQRLWNVGRRRGLSPHNRLPLELQIEHEDALWDELYDMSADERGQLIANLRSESALLLDVRDELQEMNPELRQWKVLEWRKELAAERRRRDRFYGRGHQLDTTQPNV